MSADNDYVVTEPLYLDKDGKVVKHKDPTKVEKLADVGHRIPYDRAKALGLVDGAIEEEEESTEEDAAPKAKATKKPAAKKK